MASSGKIASGNTTYTSSLSSATAVDEVQFSSRYEYVTVTNLGTSGDLYATGDGSAPQVSGAGTSVVVPPGESRVIANGLPSWYQSSNVIAQGGDNADQESKAGQLANPGTTINVTGAANSYQVAGT